MKSDEPGARLGLHVTPRAARTEAAGWGPDGLLKLRVKAPPVDGAANEAVIAWVAETLGVRRSAVSLVQGATGRRKVVEVAGVAPEVLRAALDSILARRGRAGT